MKFVKLSLVIFFMLLLGGCSVYMAAHQPSEKNVGLFKVGTSRDALIAEFGVPVTSGVRDGKKYEIFRFKQGYSQGAKTARALVEGTADVFTLGVTEVISTPVEAINDGDLNVYEVTYDSNDCVDQVMVLTPNTNLSPPTQPSPQPASTTQSQPQSNPK
jgi:outer membrane protein assembly factor BamE (lipoprotein component of BamABCDE complex)